MTGGRGPEIGEKSGKVGTNSKFPSNFGTFEPPLVYYCFVYSHHIPFSLYGRAMSGRGPEIGEKSGKVGTQSRISVEFGYL